MLVEGCGGEGGQGAGNGGRASGGAKTGGNSGSGGSQAGGSGGATTQVDCPSVSACGVHRQYDHHGLALLRQLDHLGSGNGTGPWVMAGLEGGIYAQGSGGKSYSAGYGK